MSQIVPSADYWTAVLAETGDANRADAVKTLLANGTKLVFLDASGSTIRTVTTAAWSRGSQSGSYYPITPGAWTDPGTGTGTAATIVVTDSSDGEIMRFPASLFNLAVDLSSVTAVEGTAKLMYPASGTAASGKRWYPGHYFYASQDWTHDVTMVESRRNKVKNNAYFAGYKLMAWWDQMESTAGNYDFSKVVAALDAAEADGKMAWIRIEERSFHGASRGLPCPQYIYDGGGTYASTANGQNILAPKFWVPWVGEAFLDMIAALMEVIDDHPALQGVMTEECSIAGSWLQAGYTWQAMNAFILEYCRIGSAGAVNSLWHQNMGWSNEPSSDATEHYRMTDTVARTYKAGLSPTDLCASGTIATKNTTYGAYIYDRYPGEAFFATNVEYATYTGASGAKATLDYGVDTLGCHFIGWSNTDYSGAWTFTDDDAIAEVARQQGRINTTRPSNVPA